jgi:hypothetical protein
VTELDVLRERLAKIAALAGRPIRIDATEERLEEALAENRLLRERCDDLTRRLDGTAGRGLRIPRCVRCHGTARVMSECNGDPVDCPVCRP